MNERWGIKGKNMLRGTCFDYATEVHINMEKTMHFYAFYSYVH